MPRRTRSTGFRTPYRERAEPMSAVGTRQFEPSHTHILTLFGRAARSDDSDFPTRLLARRPRGHRRGHPRCHLALGRPSRRQGQRAHRGPGRGGRGRRRRRRRRVRRDPRACTGRRPGPRVQPPRGAHRGDRPADLRGERQAHEVGARRGRPRRLRLPLRRRGGPPLQRRRGAAAGHRRRRHRPARATPAASRTGPCSASRRSTSR